MLTSVVSSIMVVVKVANEPPVARALAFSREYRHGGRADRILLLTVMILRGLLSMSLSALLSCASSVPPLHAELPDSAQLLFDRPRIVNPRPLVIWHGLGDSYNSPGIFEFIARVKDMHPGIFVHSISIAESLDDDRRATFVRITAVSTCYGPRSSADPLTRETTVRKRERASRAGRRATCQCD